MRGTVNSRKNGRMMKAARLRTELSRKALADKAGISVSALRAIELGWWLPSALTITKLYGVFKNYKGALPLRDNNAN